MKLAELAFALILAAAGNNLVTLGISVLGGALLALLLTLFG